MKVTQAEKDEAVGKIYICYQPFDLSEKAPFKVRMIELEEPYSIVEYDNIYGHKIIKRVHRKCLSTECIVNNDEDTLAYCKLVITEEDIRACKPKPKISRKRIDIGSQVQNEIEAQPTTETTSVERVKIEAPLKRKRF